MQGGPLTTEILRLRDEEGLTFDEIGQRVNMHPEACRSRYRRAKKRAKGPMPTAKNHLAKRIWSASTKLLRTPRLPLIAYKPDKPK